MKLTLTDRPRENERLSWPCWLTYSGWFTHINGYPSAAGPVQTTESSLVRDRRSTTEPPNQRHPKTLRTRWICTTYHIFRIQVAFFVKKWIFSISRLNIFQKVCEYDEQAISTLGECCCFLTYRDIDYAKCPCSNFCFSVTLIRSSVTLTSTVMNTLKSKELKCHPHQELIT